jgi:hypothetical protein
VLAVVGRTRVLGPVRKRWSALLYVSGVHYTRRHPGAGEGSVGPRDRRDVCLS